MKIDIVVHCAYCGEYLETESEAEMYNDYQITVKPCQCAGGLVDDLLAACEVALPWMKSHLPDPFWSSDVFEQDAIIEQLKTAIKKAKATS